VFTLWKRAVAALVSGGVGVTAPITITTSGTGTINIGHGTSGAVTGTYGSQSRISIFAVDTYGHLTLATSSDVAIAGTAVTGANLTVSAPLTGTATNALLRAGTIGHGTSGVIGGTYGGTSGLASVVVDTWGHITAGTTFPLQATAPILVGSNAGTFTWGHSTSGAIPGTYGNQSSIPILVVNTFGHVTLATSSAASLAGTAVTGADLTISAPLVGTATNALLRAGTIGHGTSGVTTGTYGGAASWLAVNVDTYGHVRAVSTFAPTGTAITGADVTATTPILVSGTSTNAALRPFVIAHATSGVLPSTYGGTHGKAQVVVNTYGHITSATNAGETIPQNIQNGTYTLVAADSGKHLYRAGTATGVAQWVIPSNAQVAFDPGTPVTMVNDGTGNVTVAINSDTLVFAGTGATGSRTLPQYGMASILKVTSTRWLISGAGVS
jgi:hypothetical protein